jgi:hypothetical protein
MLAITITTTKRGPFNQHQLQLFRAADSKTWRYFCNLGNPEVSRDQLRQRAWKYAKRNNMPFIEGLRNNQPVDSQLTTGGVCVTL